MSEQRGIIVAVSPEGVIGVGRRLPWDYPGDLKRFKRVTMGSTIIMGRRTWESLRSRALPGRRNIVITSKEILHHDSFKNVPSALATCSGRVWFIGGAEIYAEAMKYVDIIDMTQVPDHFDVPDAIYFPRVDPDVWAAGPTIEHEDDRRLHRIVYRRRESRENE